MEVDLTYFELKYCERCGGLWLRPSGASSTYCEPCARMIEDLPQPGRPLPVRPARVFSSAAPAVVVGFALLVLPGVEAFWGYCA